MEEMKDRGPGQMMIARQFGGFAIIIPEIGIIELDDAQALGMATYIINEIKEGNEAEGGTIQ